MRKKKRIEYNSWEEDLSYIWNNTLQYNILRFVLYKVTSTVYKYYTIVTCKVHSMTIA